MRTRATTEQFPTKMQARRSESGQSFVEFALILVFMLILLSAVADLGWMFVNGVSIREAAQEGAAFASVCPNDVAKIQARVRNSSSHPFDLSTVPSDQIEICVIDPGSGSCGGALAIGNRVRVTLTYNHNIFTPFVGVFIGSQSYPIEGAATATILKTTCASGL